MLPHPFVALALAIAALLPGVGYTADVVPIATPAAAEIPLPKGYWAKAAPGGEGTFRITTDGTDGFLCEMTAAAPARLQLGTAWTPATADLGSPWTISTRVKGRIDKLSSPGLGVLFIASVTGAGKTQTLQLVPGTAPQVNGDEHRLKPTSGEFDWTPLVVTFTLPRDTERVTLLLYLHNASGSLTWAKPQWQPAPDNAPLTAMLPAQLGPTEEDLRKEMQVWDETNRQALDALGCPGADQLWRPRAALAAPHPRYMFTGTPLAEVKRRFQDPAYARYRAALLSQAQALAAKPFPTCDRTNQDAHLAEALPYLALAALLADEPDTRSQFVAAARRWTEGFIAVGLPVDNLTLANNSLCIAVVYDWLYNEWPPEFRAQVRDHLIRSARGARSTANASSQMFRNRQWLANHRLFNFAGIAMVAAVLWGDATAPVEPGELQKWIDEAMQSYWVFVHTLGADGAPVEGYMYMAYGNRPYQYFTSLAEELTECAIPLMAAIRPQAENQLHALLPAGQGFFSYGDSFVFDPLNLSGTPVFRRIASRFRAASAQLLADRMETLYDDSRKTAFPIPADKRVNYPEYAPVNWRQLFWYNPTVPRAEFAELPLYRDNRDLGTFVARSSWTDPHANWFGLVAGPGSGETVVAVWGKTLNNGHTNPQQGAFQFYAGPHPIVPPVKYPKPKMTSAYPVTVFEGRGPRAGQLQGQRSEGQDWFMDSDVRWIRSYAKTLAVVHEADHHSYLCDLGGLYALEDERTPGRFLYPSYRRSLTFFPKSGVVVVVDRIRTELPRRAHFRIPLSTTNLTQDGSRFRFSVGTVTGCLVNCSPQPVEYAITTEKVGAHPPKGEPRQVATLKSGEATETVFAAVLGINGAEDSVTVVADSQVITIQPKDGEPINLAWHDDITVPPAREPRTSGFRGLPFWVEQANPADRTAHE